MPRAVIFDLDGTLVDSLDDIAAALGGAMLAIGRAAPERDRVAAWIGDGARNLVARAVGGPGADADAAFAAFQRLYRLTPIAQTRPYAGIPEALEALARRGLVLAVLSNKPHDLTTTIVEALFPGRFAAVAGERPGVPRKPHPEAGATLARELGIPPSECVLVGDSEIDVHAARAAGMGAIGVSWGLRPRAELVAADPDAIIDDPAELHAI